MTTYRSGDRVLVTTRELPAVVERVDDPTLPGFYAVRPSHPNIMDCTVFSACEDVQGDTATVPAKAKPAPRRKGKK